MADTQNILYVQTSNLPERQYSPLVLAQSAKAMDLDAAVYYLGMGLTVLKPGAAEEMQLGSFPSVAEMLRKTLDMAITIYVCEASKQMLGWEGGAHRRRHDRGCGDAQRPRPRRRRHDVVLRPWR